MKYLLLIVLVLVLSGCSGGPAQRHEKNEGERGWWFKYHDPWNNNEVHCIRNDWDGNQWCYVVGSEEK